MKRRSLKATIALSATVLAVMLNGTGARAQKLSPVDLAGKFSGTWVLNRDLSTGFGAPGRPGGGARSSSRPLFATAAAITQRGGGRGGGGYSDASDLTPEQRAEQAAMRQLQQIAPQMTIKASAESITFVDARGERTFAINDKTSKIDVAGAQVSVKSKWDKNQLKQEFSNTQARLVETWSIDDAGRLVLIAKLESMTLMTADQKAVFDRQ
jgi:uncharacterized protein YnzC (UPF0291/DUF896 family)